MSDHSPSQPAVDPKFVRDCFIAGLRCATGKGALQDFKAAADWYRKAADLGHTNSQYLLGDLYEGGSGVPQDFTAAANWYHKAAERGHMGAQLSLGICYITGKGVPEDFNAGAKWYRRAAEQGDPFAQFLLGYLYECGLGVPLDFTAASGWYRKAAEQGHEKARISLAQLRKHEPSASKGFKPSAQSSLSTTKSPAINEELKRTHQKRREEVRRKSLPPAEAAPKVKVTPCPVCGTKIANHALKMHLRDYHRPEPKQVSNSQKRSLLTGQTGLTLSRAPALVIKETQPVVHDQSVAMRSRGGHAICPRCGGDGGVRAGCRKCDGTGWVPKEMERDHIYQPTQYVSDNSRVSNADYLGGNLGAHFREMDGRIGSIPTYDDYSEEG